MSQRIQIQGFCDQAYELPAKNIAAQKCINLYPENIEASGEKVQTVLLGTPGLNLHAYLPTSSIVLSASPRQNGILNGSDGYQYIIAGSYLYKNDIVGIDNGLVIANPPANFAAGSLGADGIGPILSGVGGTDHGPVSMRDNGIIGMVVDGANYWVWTLARADLVPRKVSDAALTGGATHIAYMDGRFILNVKGTNTFQCSTLDWDGAQAFDFGAVGLLTASADQSPDNIQGLIVVGRDLWIFGTQSFEIWYDAGTSPFPFARNISIAGQIGLYAPYSLAQIQNTVFWLGSGVEGSGIIYRSNGYTPQRISTHAVEQAILGYTSIDDAIAFCYQEAGHSFYVITFQNADQTWVYDLSTEKWHQRLYRDTNTGLFTRWRPVACGGFNGSNYVLDRITGYLKNAATGLTYQTAYLHKLDQNFYTDNGDPIERVRSTPHIWSQLDRVFYNRVECDLEPGVGNTNDPDSNPLIKLRWSDDGGHTWSMPITVSMGKDGVYLQRMIWNRCGYSRNRVFEISTSAATPVRLLGLFADIDVGGG